MNKRLRKKKRVGEFVELGVSIFGYWTNDVPGYVEHSVFVDALIAYADARNISFGGGGNDPFEYVFSRDRGSLTAENAAALLAIVRASPIVKAACAGPLIDMWHTSDARAERIESEAVRTLSQ